jgi:chromate transporter
MKEGDFETRQCCEFFFKVGLFGFGGGSALIPVIEKEIVHNKKMVSCKEFNDYLIAGSITPGAIQIKLAAACGEKISGTLGLLAASYAITIPGTFLTILLLSLLSTRSDAFLLQVEKASVGITAFIVYLLFMYVIKVMQDSKKQGFLIQALVIMLITTLLTFGKEVRKILSLLFR